MKLLIWSGHHTANLAAPNNRKRLRQFREFVGRQDFEGVKVLDIGAANYISRELKIADNTRGDLNKHDYRVPNSDYEVITCLEVLQHVINPGFLVRDMFNLLAPGGRLYLATPRRRDFEFIGWYHGRGNFAEYTPWRIKMLFEYFGFESVRMEVRNPWPWYFCFYGIRPPFRWLINRYQLWEFRKP